MFKVALDPAPMCGCGCYRSPLIRVLHQIGSPLVFAVHSAYSLLMFAPFLRPGAVEIYTTHNGTTPYQRMSALMGFLGLQKRESVCVCVWQRKCCCCCCGAVSTDFATGVAVAAFLLRRCSFAPCQMRKSSSLSLPSLLRKSPF